MRVLLRAKVPYINNWGLELLVMQLYDQSKLVAMEALSVISEACENEVSNCFPVCVCVCLCVLSHLSNYVLLYRQTCLH